MERHAQWELAMESMGLGHRHGAGARDGPADGAAPRRGGAGAEGRRRMRRGDIRRAILSALLDGPAHGYEIMQRLEARTGGAVARTPARSTPPSRC